MIGELLSNTYRIKRLIARGGMGEVFEATHERTGAPFAIKILLADFGGKEELLARFQREAEITSRLRHPNIVKVFDVDRLPDGRPFLAMELLQGQPLDTILAPGQPLPLARVATIVDQVGLALAAAHDAGVVHRDLKPANLFVEALAGTDRELVRVLDFGISKVHDAGRLTHTSTIIGTPYYMSPEQALGRSREIDARSDQFALAAIVYELLTGRMAFGADEANSDEMIAIVYRVVHAEPPLFASLGIHLPPEIEAVVRKGLAKRPADRFESVAAFAAAFAASTRNPVGNMPPPAAAAGALAPGFKTTPLPRLREVAKTLPIPTTLVSASGERLRRTAQEAPDLPPRRRWMPWGAAALGVAVIGMALFGLWGGAGSVTTVDSVPAVAPPAVPAAAPVAPPPTAAPRPVVEAPPPVVEAPPPPPPPSTTPAAKPPVPEPVRAAINKPREPPRTARGPEKKSTKAAKRSPASAAAKPNEDIF